MNQSNRLDIDDIRIIVHKSEGKNFSYYNSKRMLDGLVLVTRGQGWVTDSEGIKHKISVGDIILLSYGDEYKIEFRDECSYVTSAFSLKTDKALLPFVHKCNKIEFDEIMDVCKIWQSRSLYSYTKCRIKLMNFYLRLLENKPAVRDSEYHTERALEFIQDNFKRNFSCAELADFCSISPSYMRGIFQKNTGCTIMGYRDLLRITAAKEMLESRIFTISEIAEELGFCDVYHFSKKFRQACGSSPAKWIKGQKTQTIKDGP